MKKRAQRAAIRRQKKHHTQKKSSWVIYAIVGCLALLITASFGVSTLVRNFGNVLGIQAGSVPAPKLQNIHFIGAFSAYLTSEIGLAAGQGIQYSLVYNETDTAKPYPSGGYDIDNQLYQNNMGLIDGYSSHQVQLFTSGKISEGQVLTNIQNHMNAINSSTNIKGQTGLSSILRGFWILDDQTNGADNGKAKGLLQKIHALVHAKYPDSVTICGFGPLFGYKWGGSGWNPSGLYKDFSPGGCDMVGIYAYAQPGLGDRNPNDYDWSMSYLLPTTLKYLSDNGWNSHIPLVGIPMAFGGSTGGNNWVTPTSDNIAMQMQSFCSNKAVKGIIPYAYHNGNSNDTVAKNETIRKGVLSGILTCERYWYGVCTPPQGGQGVCTSNSNPPSGWYMGYSDTVGSNSSQCARNALAAGDAKGSPIYCISTNPPLTPTPPVEVQGTVQATSICSNGVSSVTFSWNSAAGAKSYILDFWEKINGEYNEFEVYPIYGSSVTLPSTQYSMLHTHGTAAVPSIATGGFAGNTQVGVSVNVESPLAPHSGYTKPTYVTTKSCSSTSSGTNTTSQSTTTNISSGGSLGGSSPTNSTLPASGIANH